MREQNNFQRTQDQTNNLTGNVWKFYLYRGTFGFGKGLLIFQWIFAPIRSGAVIWVWVALGRTPIPSPAS